MFHKHFKERYRLIDPAFVQHVFSYLALSSIVSNLHMAVYIMRAAKFPSNVLDEF